MEVPAENKYASNDVVNDDVEMVAARPEQDMVPGDIEAWSEET